MRLTASADPGQWVEITGSAGIRDRRHQKAAIRLMTASSAKAWSQLTFPGARAVPWLIRRLVPRAIKASDGRMLVWSWRADPELLVATAQIQQMTPAMRIARANLPIEYDDTEDFRTALGSGEKLVMALPPEPDASPFVSYTWDTGTHLVVLTALCPDRERFGTFVPALDDLARSLRIVEDLTGDERDVLRLPPA